MINSGTLFNTFTTEKNQPKPVQQPKFGNDDDLFNSSAFEDTSSDYSSTEPIDYSKRVEKKTPFRATQTYKVIHEGVGKADGVLNSGFSTIMAVLAIIGGITAGVTALDQNERDNAQMFSDYKVSEHDEELTEFANELEKDINTINQSLGERGHDLIVDRMTPAIYTYLDNVDLGYRTYGQAPISLTDYVNPENTDLSEAQQQELESLFLEMIRSENLDDYKTLTDTLIDDYMAPAIAESEGIQDDADLALYKQGVHDYFDRMNSEQRPFKIGFTTFKYATMAGLYSALVAFTNKKLPYPKPE